jgi:Kef-type K+ transport system membrane component KefB
MVAETVGLALAILGVVRPLLTNWIKRSLKANEGFSDNLMAVILIAMFLCAIATSLIGIFAVFGAAVLGASLSGIEDFKTLFLQRARTLITTLFLPIFFTLTGLKTRMGSLQTVELGVMALAVCALAIIGKYGGCLLAARASGLGWRESHCIGALMNTRGLMELIAVNIGRDLGVIPESVYCMLILMALATTAMTTPVVLRMMVGTELQPFVERSDFSQRRRERNKDAKNVGVCT